MSDCEWNPVLGETAMTKPRDTDCGNEAEYRVGDYHLCARCAELPVFARKKKRRLKESGALSEYGVIPAWDQVSE